jgi:hypothetical protein
MMKLIMFFFCCCLAGLAQQEQKTETKKPAAEQVKQEPAKKSARDPNNSPHYSYEEFCVRTFYFFDRPQLWVRLFEQAYPEFVGDQRIYRPSWFGRVILRRPVLKSWKPNVISVQHEMMQKAAIAGCVW